LTSGKTLGKVTTTDSEGYPNRKGNTMTPIEQACETWQKFGKMETVMVAILTQLITTIERLEKEKGTEQ